MVAHSNSNTSSVDVNALVVDFLALLSKYGVDVSGAIPPAARPPRTQVETKGDVTLWSDGSVSSALLDAYIATFKGTGTPAHNFFFSDTGSVFTLNQEQTDNVGYNQSFAHSGLIGQWLTSVDAMAPSFSAVLGSNNRYGHVQGMPDAFTSTQSVSAIPVIVREWGAKGSYPIIISNDWKVV